MSRFVGIKMGLNRLEAGKGAFMYNFICAGHLKKFEILDFLQSMRFCDNCYVERFDPVLMVF